MDKNKKLAFAGAVLFVAVFAFAFFLQGTGGNGTPDKPPGTHPVVPGEQPDDSDVSDSGEEDLVDTERDFDEEYFEKAVEEDNAVYCGMLSDEEKQEECFGTVSNFKPIEEETGPAGDPEFDDYYFSKAQSEENSVYCGMIVSEELMQECFDLEYESKNVSETDSQNIGDEQ